MVNCSYCSKKLDRKVFCNDSHKVMFHRKKGLDEQTIAEDANKFYRQNVGLKEKEIETCKHGSAKGLCKKGC